MCQTISFTPSKSAGLSADFRQASSGPVSHSRIRERPFPIALAFKLDLSGGSLHHATYSALPGSCNLTHTRAEKPLEDHLLPTRIAKAPGWNLARA